MATSGESTGGDREGREWPYILRWIVLAILTVISVQGIWVLSLALFVPSGSETWGQIGDLFGGVNALFTGLAFAGLVYTIHLQRRDLTMQSEELKLTRDELKGSREALDAQVGLLQDSTRLSVIATLTDNYTRQIATMEQGNFRGKLYEADSDVLQWARKKADEPLDDWEARERGVKLDSYLNNEKYPPIFRTSFEAWIHARRERERLVSMLEDMFKEVERNRWGASGGAESGERI